MKRKANILRGRTRTSALPRRAGTTALPGRPWLVLLALLAWLLPQRAAATYVDEKSNYSVMLGGSNVIYFYAPVYDMDGADCWIADGNLEVSVDGGSSTTIFHWAAPENVDNDLTELSTAFSTTADGTFEITLGNSKSKAQLNKNNGRNLSLTRNGGGKSYTYFFTPESSLPLLRCGHSVELPVIFNHQEITSEMGWTFDATFSKTMRRMWVQFAKTGNPSLSASESPDGKAKEWPLYDLENKQLMIFDEFNIHPEKESQRKILDWDRTYFLTKYYCI